jgi:hypothetical protein
MNPVLKVRLRTTPDQQHRLEALQQAFAEACNALAPVVQKNRCWNRVALHHLAYRQLRQHFPGIGSQMACNAIYSVCRASRFIYQHPKSPFNLSRLGDRPLPLLRFAPQAPVYFDRHTLSIKAGEISMFTLDGRMRFQLDLSPDQERRFREDKLREIVMTSAADELALTFSFAIADGADPTTRSSADAMTDEFPEYLVVIDDPVPVPPAAAVESAAVSP